jgi:ribosome-associated protein
LELGARRIDRSRELEDPTLTLSPPTATTQQARNPIVSLANRLPAVIIAGLEDAKAEDVVSIDIMGKTTLADCMIVATGRSSTHVGAIADRVIKACREAGFPAPKIEGLPHCDWVLLDARDAIVHIFRPEVRQFYNLEKMWSADRPGEARKG